MREYWKKVAGHLFDFQDYYQEIAEGLPEGGRLVEVGVANGQSLIYLAEALLNLGKAFRLVGIDDCSYGGQQQRNAIMGNITRAGLGDVIEFWEMDSLAASCQFNDGYLDFVFIDSSHKYEETKAEIRLWYHKVKEGGILAGHDIYREEAVMQAVSQVIPKVVTRPPLDETIFEPVFVLALMDTAFDHGIWEAKKIWYVNLK